MASDTNKLSFWTQGMEMEPELTERERALRDYFVSQYLLDYDPVAAAQRCGFMKSFAVEYAKRFMAEAYVQTRIKDVELDSTDSKAEARSDKLRVMASLRRVAYSDATPPAARVAALAKLGEYVGIERVGKGKEAHRGGVMEVPAIADMEAWEEAASASQDKLVADARS